MGLKYHAADYTEHPNGSRVYRTPDLFASIAKVTNCPCEDGIRRNAFATAEPDTFFSIPACIYVGKKTVGGYLTTDDDGWQFIAYSYGKNASLIKTRFRGVVMKTRSKQMPKGEARPLGTKPAKKAAAKKTLTKVVDSVAALKVDLPQVESNPAIDTAAQSAIAAETQQEHSMTLTLKSLSKNGKRAIYTGAAMSIHFSVGAFANKSAPVCFDVADGVFAVAKVKLTAEERKALSASKPKPTLAEKAAAAQKRADALKAKADAANAM